MSLSNTRIHAPSGRIHVCDRGHRDAFRRPAFTAVSGVPQRSLSDFLSANGVGYLHTWRSVTVRQNGRSDMSFSAQCYFI